MRLIKKHTYNKLFLQTMLAVYVFGNLNILIPIVNNTISHLFFEQKHIATVHLENGKYHLHLDINKQLEKSKKNQAEKSTNVDNLYAHVITNFLSLNFTKLSYFKVNDNNNYSVCCFFIKPTSPPPKQVV